MRPSKPRAASVSAQLPVIVWISREHGLWIARATGVGEGALDQERSLTTVKEHMERELVPWIMGGTTPIRRRIVWKRVPLAWWERETAAV